MSRDEFTRQFRTIKWIAVFLSLVWASLAGFGIWVLWQVAKHLPKIGGAA